MPASSRSHWQISNTQTSAVYEGEKISNVLGNQGSSEKAEVKREISREVLNCEREQLCQMWGGRLFQTRGAWTENASEQSPWVSILHRKEFFHWNWNTEYEIECTQRQDDRCGGKVPSKKRKAKVAILKSILKSILSLTGSQWSFLRSGETCSCLLWRKMAIVTPKCLGPL